MSGHWVLNNEYKTLTVYLFEGEKAITRTYRENDTVLVAVLKGLSIELAPVFSE